MMQGISFSIDGPVMTGTWYNPKNGDSFTVRDTYFEDNQYMVITTDGRRMDYNMIQSYIKSDTPIQKMEQPKPTQQSNQIKIGDIEETGNEIISNYDEMILEDDALLLQTKTSPQLEFTSSRRVNLDGNKIDSKPTNYYIIDKALSKIKKPKFELKCKWDKFPKQEIEMLKDIMDISLDEIRDYIFEKFIDESYKDELKKQLNKVISENLELPEPKTVKKTNNKK
jgi:hypothetical protein